MLEFNVVMNDDDYLEYNKFHMFKSPYGRRSTVGTQIMISVIMAIFVLVNLIRGSFSTESFVRAIPFVILLVLCLLCYKPLLMFFLKQQLKSYKKSGKMGYSPVSKITFYEDRFEEITETNKTEQSYSSIERISVVGEKYIYIHVNSIMAYIVPFSCIESREQYDELMSLLGEACHKIDIYK